MTMTALNKDMQVQLEGEDLEFLQPGLPNDAQQELKWCVYCLIPPVCCLVVLGPVRFQHNYLTQPEVAPTSAIAIKRPTLHNVVQPCVLKDCILSVIQAA